MAISKVVSNLSYKEVSEEFWQWSCRVYQYSSVRKLCLLLQDEHQLNVNFLLLAIWSGQQNIVLIIEDWQEISIKCEPIVLKIQQIRVQRRRLKSISSPQYQKALEIELKGEKFLQNQAVKYLLALQNNKKVRSKNKKKTNSEVLSYNLQEYLKQQKVLKKTKIKAIELQELVHRLVD